MARPKKFAIHRGKSLETRTDTQFKNKIDEFFSHNLSISWRNISS